MNIINRAYIIYLSKNNIDMESTVLGNCQFLAYIGLMNA